MKKNWDDKLNALPRIPRAKTELGYLETLEIIFNAIQEQRPSDEIIKITGSDANHTLNHYIKILKSYKLVYTNGENEIKICKELENWKEPNFDEKVGEFLYENIKYISEMLFFLTTSKKTKEILEDANSNFNFTWKQKGQVHERIGWLTDIGLINSMSFKQQYEISEKGIRFLKDHPPTPPIDIKKFILDKTQDEKNISLSEWILNIDLTDNQEKKHTLGYVPGGKSNTIPLIISVLEFSTEIVDYDNLYQFLKRKTDTKKSSINSFLTFMTNLDLLDRVGEKVYKTTEVGIKFCETDTPEIALLFLLQKNYRYILEILFELKDESKTPNELAVAGLTKYGMSSDNKDRINERLSLLRNAQLIINDKGKSIKLSKRGENLLKVLIEKDDFQLNKEMSEQTKVEEKGTENYLSIIEETRLASVNSAKPHCFEEMLEKMFEMLGFNTKLEAKSGTTDIVLTAPTVPTFAYKVAIEAKTNRDGKITDKMINFDALLEHKEKHKTDYIAIVGKTFYGERVFRYAENHNILLIDINDLEELVKKHQKYPLQAIEYKKVFNQKGKVNIRILDDIYISMKRRKVLFQLILKALIQNSDDDFTEGFLTEREIYLTIKGDELFKESPVTKKEVRDMLSLLSNSLIGCIGADGKGYYAKGSLEDAQLKFGFYYSATLV